MLSSPYIERLDHRNLDFNGACSAFTHVATRQLAHQPKADFVGRLHHVDCSPCCYPSYPPQAERDFPHLSESHPMDHDSNSSGHTKSKDLTPRSEWFLAFLCRIRSRSSLT